MAASGIEGQGDVPLVRRRAADDLRTASPTLLGNSSRNLCLSSCAAPVPSQDKNQVRTGPDRPIHREGVKPETIATQGFPGVSVGSGGGTRTLNFRINGLAPLNPPPA